MERNTSTTDRTAETTREPLAQHGQYTIAKIEQIEGVMPTFNAYDLIIRGHTSLMVADQNGTNTLEALDISFTPHIAVQDIGVELLRASHVVIPLEGIQALEHVTDSQYNDSRWIENPLNYSPPFREQPVTYPSDPAAMVPGDTDTDDDDDGAIPVNM